MSPTTPFSIRILPQYGSFSSPGFWNYKRIISTTGAAANSNPAPLLRLHPLDTYLNTSPTDADAVFSSLKPHQAIAALTDLNGEEQVSPSNILGLTVEPNLGVGQLRLQQGGLTMVMSVGPDEIRTDSYTISTNTAGLHDFLKASLGHFNGIPHQLLDGVPDFLTATNDDLMLAANLIFYQMFLMGQKKPPFDFLPVAQADSSLQHSHFETVFVQSLANRAQNALTLKRQVGTDQIEITIHNTLDHGEALLPLFGNVLILGARAMLPDLKGLPFLDNLTV